MSVSLVGAAQKEPAKPPEPDDDLLLIMGMKSECPIEAREAWARFFCRHRLYVFSLAKHFYPSRDRESRDSLVVETFTLAWEKAAKFDPKGVTDAKRIERRARAWLGFLLKKAYCRLFSRHEDEKTFDDDFWQVRLDQKDRTAAPSVQSMRVAQALANLTEREKSIILTAGQYCDLDNPTKHLPDSVLHALAQEWDTTTENIRQIRHRASKKLRDQVGSVIK